MKNMLLFAFKVAQICARNLKIYLKNMPKSNFAKLRLKYKKSRAQDDISEVDHETTNKLNLNTDWGIGNGGVDRMRAFDKQWCGESFPNDLPLRLAQSR